MQGHRVKGGRAQLQIRPDRIQHASRDPARSFCRLDQRGAVFRAYICSWGNLLQLRNFCLSNCLGYVISRVTVGLAGTGISIIMTHVGVNPAWHQLLS